MNAENTRTAKRILFSQFLLLCLIGMIFTDALYPTTYSSIEGILSAIEKNSRELSLYQNLNFCLRNDLLNTCEASRSPLLSQASLFFDARLKESPRNPYLLYGKGLTAKLSGEYDSSIYFFEAGIQAGARFWSIYEELIPYYRTKKEILHSIDLLRNELNVQTGNSFIYQGLGFLYFWIDKYDEARSHYNRALYLQKKAGNIKAYTKCLYYRAYLRMYVNQYEQAKREIDQSIHTARKIGDLSAEVRNMDLLGFLLIEQGKIPESLRLARKTLEKSEQLNNLKIEAKCRMTMGVALMEAGNLASAEDYFNQSSNMFRLFQEDRYREIVFYWQSILYQQLGDYSRSLALAHHALSLSQREGFKTAQAFNLSAIGKIYHSLGHYEKALSYNQKALLLSQNYIGKWSREKCLNAIGAVYMETARYHEALESFKKALEYIQRIDHNRQTARCLYNIGLANLALGNADIAFNYFLQSMVEAERGGKQVILGLAMVRLGNQALSQGRLGEAEEMFRKSLEISTNTGHPEIRWRAYAGLGDLAEKSNRVLEAADLYENAIAVIEDQRNHIMERQHSAGFFQSKVGIYEKLINLYYGLHIINPDKGYDQACFNSAERAKSRAFLDDLQAARIDPRTFPASPAARRKIETLSQKVSQILTTLSRSDLNRDEREKLWENLERTEEDLQIAVEEARRMRPDLAQLLKCEPSKVTDIQKDILAPDTGLIEFLVGEKNLFIFFVTQNKLTVHRIDETETKIILELARNYASLISSPHMSSFDCAEAGKRLYEILILPGKKIFTDEIRHLFLVPDYELCRFPFETLIAETNPKVKNEYPDYLVFNYTFTYGPSASALANIAGRQFLMKAEKYLLAIGNPRYPENKDISQPEWDNLLEEYYLEKRFKMEPLPYSRQEIKGISRYFSKDKKDILLGEKATEENVKNLPLNKYKILHFATHSLLDEQVASRSALVLTQDDDPKQDGFFQVHEIYRQRLNADLVVLSACQTGLGKREKGEGIQGLPRAFFSAGADSVVVSLWPVRDRLSSAFMERFYFYLSKGEAKREALRLAKIESIKKEGSKPCHWSSFILMGKGKNSLDFQKPSFWERIISHLF